MHQLDADQAHLWLCQPNNISDPSLLKQYHQLLNEAELKRYQRFHFEKDRHRHLVTRALIRSVLSYYQPQVHPKDWLFDHNAYGKPSVVNPISMELEFNITHSNDFIAVAISHGRTIGVDIEYIRNRDNLKGLADYCFNEAEKAYIFDKDESESAIRFYQMWTLKESYIKANGKGLSIPLKDILFKIADSTISIEFIGKHQDKQNQWQFHSSMLTQDYQLGITLAKSPHSKPTLVKMIDCIPLLEHSVNSKFTLKLSN